MSRHIVELGPRKVVQKGTGEQVEVTWKYVFGWDQPLMSFYLQVHDMALPEDDRIFAWLGSTKEDPMYEVEELVREARKYGLTISYQTQVHLYGEKDDGR